MPSGVFVNDGPAPVRKIIPDVLAATSFEVVGAVADLLFADPDEPQLASRRRAGYHNAAQGRNHLLP